MDAWLSKPGSNIYNLVRIAAHQFNKDDSSCISDNIYAKVYHTHDFHQLKLTEMVTDRYSMRSFRYWKGRDKNPVSSLDREIVLSINMHGPYSDG